MSQNFYAVRAGKQPGIYNTWDECKEQVIGFKDAKYMKFNSLESATAFMNSEVETYKFSNEFIASIKYDSIIAEFNYPAKDWNKYNDDYYIFTDGSKRGDIQRYAIYFGEAAMNIVQELPDTTHNRCELFAILKALEFILLNSSSINSNGNTKVNIISDSEYSVKSCNAWIPAWKARGWKTTIGTEVANEDIMKALDHIMNKLVNAKVKYNIIHIHSHENPPLDDEFAMFLWRGNKVVDLLAQGKI